VLFGKDTSLRRAITRRRQDSKNAEASPSGEFVSVLRIRLLAFIAGLNVRKLLLFVVKQRDSDRERDSSGIASATTGERESEGESYDGGLRRHPCRVVGDGSNRDQLVCKSHVNIAHSPGTEVSEASRSISRSLDMSFSLISTALVRFYPTPSVSLSLSFSVAEHRREEIKAGTK